MGETQEVIAQFQGDVTAIGQRIDKLAADNRRMLALLSQAALFIACQPPNRFRTKWLEEVQELIDG